MGGNRRNVAFAVAAVVLFATALLLAFRTPGRTPRSGAQPPVATTAIRTGQPPSKSGSMQTPRSASPSLSRLHSPSAAGAGPGEREARSAPAVAPYAAARAERTARTFLVGYLPYSYGRARAERIRAAARQLVRELERTPPRVPAAVARADPQLISVHADATLSELAINVVAVVDDGQQRYRVPLELRRTHGRWVVTAVGG